ncbi:MAG: adenosine deaminase [Acidimicrobiia bacterium]|nr:adenosine deaminase [Acidimicrobiia bacterium]
MTPELLRALPKVELHNHLDGGLRIATVIELADDLAYGALPTTDHEALAAWFYRGGSGSLEQYLAGFEHTIGVMQTAAAIERVAYEAVEDLHADGVIYAEIRFAPVLNTQRNLRREDAIEAALAGFAKGREVTGVGVGLIVDGMRDRPDTAADARAAVRLAGDGVVGFDLAGPERGYPAAAHSEACAIALDGGLGLTIHAGEADGPLSIADALDSCAAQRIGHGIRIMDDAGGAIAARVRDERVPLEVCPTSNLHTLGIAPADHPLGRLLRTGFNVTLNTDNRLMSSVSLTDEFAFAAEHHGFGRKDLAQVTANAVDALFVDDETKRSLRARVNAGYAS